MKSTKMFCLGVLMVLSFVFTAAVISQADDAMMNKDDAMMASNSEMMNQDNAAMNKDDGMMKKDDGMAMNNEMGKQQ